VEAGNNPFRNAGIALLCIGIIDTAVMVYCITNDISYSSSLNIFAVLAGLFLIKGSVGTARVVRWFSAFLVVAFIGSFLLYLAVAPFGLLLMQIKIYPVWLVGGFTLGLVFIAVLIWVHLQLSSPESLRVLAQAGYGTDKPKSAYIAAGALLVAGLLLAMWVTNGIWSDTAKALAENQLGPRYEYHVSSVSAAGGERSAWVTAYNKTEIRHIQVQWENTQPAVE
jgi:hypothetical protein